MNREVFGEYTDNFLAMRLPIEAVRSRDISENVAAHIVEGTNYIQVHPTFLYESLWNLMILLIMLVYRKHKKVLRGEICLLYFGGYGLGRFWIEGIRTDTLFIPGTIPRCIAGIISVHGDLRGGDGHCGTYAPEKTAESGKN